MSDTSSTDDEFFEAYPDDMPEIELSAVVH
jgi:hypothetical protein